MSRSVLVYCGEMCGDSRLNNLDETFTSFCRTPLHIAVMCCDIEFSRLILSDLHHFTLLQREKSLDMVKLLLKAKPDACMVQDKDGKTPLHLAAMKDRVEIMKLLLEERPQAIHLKNNQNGETILHFCVKSNTNLTTLKLLVDRLVLPQTTYPNPISIDSKDNDGNTVLHLVAEMGKIKIVNYLLQSNNIRIDIDAINNKGLKALSLLSQVDRNDLEIGFHNYYGQTKSLRMKRRTERVDALLVVATLIAGIAFQAMLNPPGGVWQDDSEIDSGTDAVKFAYYLHCMFGSSVSDNLESYIQQNVFHNSTKRGVWEVYTQTRENVYHFIDNLLRSTTPYASTTKGLIVEDYTGATVSSYNSSDVICGFVHEKSVAQNRILVVLMCISIGCISYSYFAILSSLIPDFLITDQANVSIFQYFEICGVCGIGLLVWNVISRIVKLHKRRLTVFSYFRALFSMDASAVGKLVVLLICIFFLYNYLVFGKYVY
ncbi:hypothetical protein MKW92_037885 [Papaver armeniacum]|nr:hypothetical protein MKW92_037885 [Papaver armeniacum]